MKEVAKQKHKKNEDEPIRHTYNIVKIEDWFEPR